MAVQRQLVAINFAGGLDTKTDPKQVAQGKFLALENGVFGKTGALEKRAGYEVLPQPPTISTCEAMAAFDDELLLFSGARAVSRIEAGAAQTSQAWVDRGAVDSVIVGGRQVIRTSAAQQLNPDMAVMGGVECYVWEDSRGGVRCTLLDATTGAALLSDVVVDLAGQQPKVLPGIPGVSFDLYYSDGANTLYWVQIVPNNGATALAARVAVFTDGAAAFPFDATRFADSAATPAYLAYRATGTIRLLKLTGATITAQAVVATGPVALAFSVALSSSGTARVAVAWAVVANVSAAVYPAALGAPTLAATAMSSTSAGIVRLSMIDKGASDWSVYMEDYNSGLGYSTVHIGTVKPGAGTPVSLGGVVIYGSGLATKPFLQTLDGQVYTCVVATHESHLQSSYFVVRTLSTVTIYDGSFVFARAQPGVGGGLRTSSLLSEAQLVDGILNAAILTKGRALSEANTLFSLLGVARLTLDFQHSNRFLTAPQSRCLHVIGGIVQSYDGVSFVEHGFLLDPEGVVAAAAGSDGFLGTGTYQYVVVYEWTDNRGQVQRSGGSVPVSVSVTATNHVTLTIPNLNVTKKSSRAGFPRADVSIVVYRTDANGLLFHRCSSTVAPLLNDDAAPTSTFVDLASDANIAANELLYTTGGVLDNAAPPACTLIVAYQGRIVLAGLEDPTLLWFSKNKFDNTNQSTIPVEFAAENTIGCDPRGGAITALGVLDDKLVIFKATSIFVLSGDGPNDTGGGAAYGDPQLVTADAGCISPNSVVTTPTGIFYQSAKGIYLLDRSLSASYVGAPVEAYNGETIISATLHATANQVIFTLDGSDTALVYDYLYQQWGTWTNQRGIDADVFEDRFCFADFDGVVHRQTPGSFVDHESTDPADDQPILLNWTTPDYSFAGLSGFQRAFRAFLLGDYRSPHSLTVSIAYDGAAYSQSATFAADATRPYGYRIDFARQRCTSVRLRVVETQAIDYGEGYSASGLTLDVGVLPGGNRVPQSQIVGAS